MGEEGEQRAEGPREWKRGKCKGGREQGGDGMGLHHGREGRKGYTLSPGLLSPMGGRVVLHVGSCMVVLCCFNPFRVMRS